MGFLSNLIGGGDKMSFYKLTNEVINWQRRGVFPLSYELPKHIVLSSDLSKRLVKLYKATRGDEFERAINVFWADGELVLSPVKRGNRVSITPRSSVEVRYVPTSNQEYFRKEVYLEGKIYSKRKVYYKKLPKSIEVKYLFNFHTHPPHEREDGSIFYSFFSAQDIKALIKTNVVMSGMIADKVWLIFRSNLTPTNVDQLTDSQINMEFLSQELHIIIYSGDFKSKLTRYDPVTAN